MLYEISNHNEEGPYWSERINRRNAVHAIIGGMLRGERDGIDDAGDPMEELYMRSYSVWVLSSFLYCVDGN